MTLESSHVFVTYLFTFDSNCNAPRDFNERRKIMVYKWSETQRKHICKLAAFVKIKIIQYVTQV